MKLAALSTLSLLTLRRIAAGRRVAVAAIVITVPAVLTALLCGMSEMDSEEIYHGVMIQFVTWIGAVLLTLMDATAMTSSEVENGAAGYVQLAALPKWAVALVQVAVTAVALSGLGFVSALEAWIVAATMGHGVTPDPMLLLRYTLASGAAVTAYLSVFVFCGYAFRAGMMVSIGLAVVWEVMVVFMPIRFAAYTVTNNVRGMILSLALEGDPAGYFWYTRGLYDFPTYGEAAMFLSIVVAVAMSAAMVAAMNRALVRAGD